MQRALCTFIVLLLLPSCIVFGQSKSKKKYQTKSKAAITAFEEGIKMYRLQYIQDAIGKLNEALEKDSLFPDPYIVLGDIHFDARKYEKAEMYYAKAIEVKKEESKGLIYSLAEAQIENLKYTQALDNLDKFLAFEGISTISTKRANGLIEIIKFRQTLVANPVPFNPINLGATINKEYYDHSPTLTVDEQIVYFTRNEPSRYKGRTQNGRLQMDEDLYLSRRLKDGTWSEAENLGRTINTAQREGAACVSPDGNYIFFTSCGKPEGLGSCDIYMAVKRGDNWVNPRNLGPEVNSRAWDSQPSFSADGRTLYFVSNRKGGKGGKDIYMTRIGDDGKWTVPTSIPINTQKNEESPFIHPDGETFYFSSDGLPGMGMRDLYFVKIKGDSDFSTPKNLGYPINSNKDEVSLSVSSNGKTAYYASDMEGGEGKWDLYSFALPEKVMPKPVTYTKGKVIDEDTKEPLRVRFEIIDLETGKTVVESYSDPENGEFLVTIPLNKDYALNASKKGYLFYSENFTVKEDAQAYAFNVPMKPMKKGQSVILKNIFFETAKYDLKPTSKVELNKLVDLMNENPAMKIEIGGHTDNVGSKSYNQTLSENRAKSVYQYLIDHQIDANRLSYKGYNFEVPVSTNETPEGRAMNRRTEFKVIGL